MCAAQKVSDGNRAALLNLAVDGRRCVPCRKSFQRRDGRCRKPNTNRLHSRIYGGQSVKSGKLIKTLVGARSERGETSSAIKRLRPRCKFGKRSEDGYVAMSGGLRRESLAVFGPGRLIGNELDELRVALRTAKFAPAFH